MRANDFIGVTVYDRAGLHLGKVHDLRLARDGQVSEASPYVITHLLVAAGTVGTRLGYGYGHMHGPWPLSALMRRSMHRGYAVRWDQIDAFDADNQMVLNATRDELMTMAELVGEANR
jgi:sporulation protein YlmC with PRC-barrel domain